MNESYLNIDPNNLDKDCCRLPKLTRQWGIELAMARRKTAEAKNKVKLVRAETRQAIRADPASFGIEKITVDAVDDALELYVTYQDAQRDLILMQEAEDVLDANIRAIRELSESLSNMTKLHGQMYWSRTGGADPEVRQQYKKMQAQQLNTEAAKLAQDSKPTRKGK